MKSEPFDPSKLGRYTVFRVHYEYTDQPPGEKLFIVLKHDSTPVPYCLGIKATSQVQRFTGSPDLLKGVVFYAGQELSFFKKDTCIDPSNFITMLHTTLAAEAKLGRYGVEGLMPPDFHGKLVAAIKSHKTLEPKKKAFLLAAIGETFIPPPGA